jgi:PAS domain S-box-containing protein
LEQRWVEPTNQTVNVKKAIGDLYFLENKDAILQKVANDAAAQMFIQAIRDQVPREVTTSSTSNRWEGELGFRSPDGIMRTLSIVLQIVRTADGVISHYSAIARDITEAKQLQDEELRILFNEGISGQFGKKKNKTSNVAEKLGIAEQSKEVAALLEQFSSDSESDDDDPNDGVIYLDDDIISIYLCLFKK